MGLAGAVSAQESSEFSSLVFSAYELTRVCASREELACLVIDGLRSCGCERSFGGHAPGQLAHRHDPVSRSDGWPGEDISMARGGRSNGSFEGWKEDPGQLKRSANDRY